MEEKKIKISNVFVMGTPSKRRMLRIISESDYPRESAEKMGRIFGLIDAGLAQENAKIFDIINEGIDRYYKNTLEHDIAFDDLISFLNRKISRVFPEKSIEKECSVIIGVLYGDKILFCGAGNITSFLIYPKGVKKILPDSEDGVLNVSGKLFNYSLNGEIFKNYTIYFCNEDLAKIINPYHLEKIIASSGTEKTITDIKDYLIGGVTSEQYGAVFIHHSQERGDGGQPISIKELFLQQQKTTDGLSPSLISSAARFFKEKPILSYLAKIAAKSLKRLFAAIKTIILFLAFLIFNFFFIITNAHGKRKEKQLAVNSRFKGIWGKIGDFYRSLTIISKLILAALLAFALFLAVGIAYNARYQKIKNLKLNYAAELKKAEKLFEDAESAALFNQKNEAAKKLGEAKNSLELIPIQIRDNSYNDFYSKIKNQLYKIQNISEINSPTLVADMSAEGNSALFPPFSLNGETLNFFTKTELITINTKSQSVKKFGLSLRGLESGVVSCYSPKNIIYSVENGSVLQKVNLATMESSLEEVLLGPDETIKAFAVYGDAMYALLLMEQHFSIWKHNPSLSGFGKPALWVTDNPPDGASPAAIAVDGNVYILFSDNSIYKYFRGQKIEWKYSTEALANGATKYFKIIADENHANIYLIGRQKISVLSKDGEFLAHYILPGVQNISDAAIDETAKTIYLMDGQKIYSFQY